MPHACRGEINDLSENFSAVYFREEPRYDSHNENKKIRRKKKLSYCFSLYDKSIFSQHCNEKL